MKNSFNQITYRMSGTKNNSAKSWGEFGSGGSQEEWETEGVKSGGSVLSYSLSLTNGQLELSAREHYSLLFILKESFVSYS